MKFKILYGAFIATVLNACGAEVEAVVPATLEVLVVAVAVVVAPRRATTHRYSQARTQPQCSKGRPRL